MIKFGTRVKIKQFGFFEGATGTVKIEMEDGKYGLWLDGFIIGVNSYIFFKSEDLELTTTA